MKCIITSHTFPHFTFNTSSHHKLSCILNVLRSARQHKKSLKSNHSMATSKAFTRPCCLLEQSTGQATLKTPRSGFLPTFYIQFRRINQMAEVINNQHNNQQSKPSPPIPNREDVKEWSDLCSTGFEVLVKVTKLTFCRETAIFCPTKHWHSGLHLHISFSIQ